MKPNPLEPCAVIGLLDDGWDGLAAPVRARLAAATLVIGAARTLAMLASHLPESRLRDMDGQLAQLPGWIAAARQAGERVAVLATGDPLCHGIGSFLAARLGSTALQILPAPSTLQLAFARLGRAWQDARIASCHSADAGEWFAGAPPAHGLYKVMRTIAHHRCVAVLTGPANNPARLARALLVAGHADARLSVACCLLQPAERIFADLTPDEASVMDFPEPNVLIVERPAETASPSFGREDDEYRQRTPEKGLITKLEARALSLAKLRLAPEAIVWDIGAGSGAVGLEAARLAPHGHVWAIEKNAGDCENARANAIALRVGNYTLVEGKAPAALDAWPDPDAVFIGGSGGELAALIHLILQRLRPNGRLVMNFVTLENLATACETLNAIGAPWDLVQLQASRSQPLLGMHRLAAQNPIWIVSARKEATCPLTEN